MATTKVSALRLRNIIAYHQAMADNAKKAAGMDDDAEPQSTETGTETVEDPQKAAAAAQAEMHSEVVRQLQEVADSLAVPNAIHQVMADPKRVVRNTSSMRWAATAGGSRMIN
jgi:hypothetical protein